MSIRKTLAVAFVVSLAGCMGGVTSACGGCFPFRFMGHHRAREVHEHDFDARDYRLTDRDVEKLARDLPEVAGDLRKLGFVVSRTPTDLGRALAEARFSELRLERLLRGDEASQLEHVRLTARFLAAKGQAVEPTHLARLILEDDPERAETLRRDIARAYFHSLHRATTQET